MRRRLFCILALVFAAGCGRSSSRMKEGPLPGGAQLTPSSAAPDRAIADFPKLSIQTDWPWWRGPTRNGIAATTAPTTWSDTENVLWKTPVPGRGHGSPCLVGDRIFLATAEETPEQLQSVLCLDRKTGDMRWSTVVHRGNFVSGGNKKSTHASTTPACDGERVYINTTGNPGMATGGSGDVLGGVIGALIGQGLPPFEAAQLGVYAHGLAGDIARDQNGEVGLIAGDIVDSLADAFYHLGT